MNEIIIGTGNEHLDELLRKELEDGEVGKVIRIVTTRQSLVKRVIEHSPSMIIVGEELIGISNTQEESDEEWENVIEEIRQFSINLRIVFFCDRSVDDLFLTKLTTYSITDIFHEGKLPADYLKQLRGEPDYKNIIRFRKTVDQATKDIKKKQMIEEEKQAEEIMQTGVIPQEGRVIKTVVPVYEQLMVRPKLIVFASAFEGAGSSSVIRVFAEYLAKFNLHVGVLESPYSKPYWYEALNGMNLVKDSWVSWHKLIDQDKQVSKGSDIHLDDVSYLVRHPNDNLANWNLMKTAYLVGYARQIPILLYDLSNNISSQHEKLILKQADKIIFTTGFDPVRVNAAQSQYSKFIEAVPLERITLLSNFSTEFLKKKYSRDLTEAYGFNKELLHFPIVDKMRVALMEGKSVWSYLDGEDELKEELSMIMRELAENILGEAVMSKLSPKPSKNWLGKLKKRRVKGH